MNTIKLSLLLIAGLGFALFFSSSVSAEHMSEFPNMECTTPTETRVIGVVSGDLKFNVSSVTMPKATCVEVIFVNSDATEHDLTALDADGEEWIHMDVSNTPEDEGTGEGQGQGIGTHYYMTPDEDITLEFYCEVEGHKELGMFFELIIGEGSTEEAPGFTLPLVIVGFLSMASLIPKIRK